MNKKYQSQILVNSLYFERGVRSFPTSNIGYVGQRYAKLHLSNFENDSNPGTLWFIKYPYLSKLPQLYLRDKYFS